MKAILQNMKTGDLAVEEVPPPTVKPGGVLVAVHRSLVSLGTDRSILALAKKGPIGKAQDRPDLARKVWNKARQEGFISTAKVVRNLLESPIPLGYSCAGTIIAVGANAGDFTVGQRVAGAGLGHANHAEINFIPVNLLTPIPDKVSYDAASFVALGAVAMQGVRLAKIELGDTVVVMGLGLVGQIAAQLARCAGANVIVSDLADEKLILARKLGAHHAVQAGDDLKRLVLDQTGSHGADSVLMCAAAKSSKPMAEAADISRLRGKVVVVGDVGLDLERRPFFEKEIELVISRSYGPGRYDPAYELHGQDYPLPYVRWTEGRNMSAFLDLINRGDIMLDDLISHRYSIDDAETAYELVSGERKEPAIAIVLEYEGKAPESQRVNLPASARVAPANDIRMGIIGAGQFAQGILLPAFNRQAVHIEGVCTSSGLTSRNVAKKYGAQFCTGDADEIFNADEINAVIIATRHDFHAPMTCKALSKGKAVFLEKPLAINPEGLALVIDAISAADNPRIMVGFNRRFSPLATQCREFFAGCNEPLFVSYRINAGALPGDSWALDPIQGGGRIVGEVCHFVDMITFLTDSTPANVFAENIPCASKNDEGVSVTLTMTDGSVGVIHYLTNGDPSISKEYIEVFGGQRTAVLDNYRTLAMHQNNKRTNRRLMNQAKGFNEEAAAFIQALNNGDPMPISSGSLIQTTQTTFLIQRSLEAGTSIAYCEPETDFQTDNPEPEASRAG